MSQTIKDAEGNDVEVFTADEIEAQKEAAIEQYKIDNPDKTDEISDLQTKLQEAEEKLTKANDSDKNFAALRKSKDEAEKKLEDFTKEIDGKISKVKMEVLEGVMQDHKNDTMKVLSGGDPELEKKIEYHYKRLGDVAGTKEEITNKLKDAYVLATKQESGSNFSNTVLGSGGVGRIKFNSTNPKFSTEEKELGAKFGLTDKDFSQK